MVQRASAVAISERNTHGGDAMRTLSMPLRTRGVSGAVPGVVSGTVLALACLLVAPPLTAQQQDRGATYQTRNDPIRIGPGAAVDVPITTRNGRVTIGDRARVRSIRSDNGRIELGAAVVAGPVLTRNGQVTVGPGSEIGRVESRNGRVEIGPGSVVAGGIETRNGRIGVGDDVSMSGDVVSRNGRVDLGAGLRLAGSVETRNGGIRLGPDGQIQGDVQTRNGAVNLETGAAVGGSVASRNGSVRLESAFVRGNVDVHGGSVRLDGASEVAGDLVVLMSEGGFLARVPWIGRAVGAVPVVRIGPDARVGGRLIVDERARLEIAPGANVPEPERLPGRGSWRR